MKKTKIFIFLFFSIILFNSANVFSQENILKAEIHINNYYDDTHERNVTVTVTNTLDTPVRILRWKLREGRIDSRIFNVIRDGKKLHYSGRIIKRAPPTENDYLVLQPNENHVVTMNLASAYDLSAPGRYDIQLIVDAFNPLSNNKTNKVIHPVGLVESNKLSIWMNGGKKAKPSAQFKKTPGSQPHKLYKSSTRYCSSSQQQSLDEAEDSAKSRTRNSRRYLENNVYYSPGDHYEKWFGQSTSTRYNTVVAGFERVSDAFYNQNIVYNCDCDENYYAYVYPYSPYEIYICQSFWPAYNDSGLNTKAGTLIHELSHFYNVADTDDHVYGSSGVQSMARNSPNRAVNNADSFEYFAETAPVSDIGGGNCKIEIPTNLSYYDSQLRSFTASWGTSKNADYYQIEIWNGDNPTTYYNSMEIRLNESQVYNENGIDKAYFRVRAIYSCGVSEYSDWKNVTLGSGSDNSGRSYQGNLRGSGADYSQNHPGGSDYIDYAGGTLKATLIGPRDSDADFDLYLYQLDETNRWKVIKESRSQNNNESISFNAPRGKYYFKVQAYKGRGEYKLTISE